VNSTSLLRHWKAAAVVLAVAALVAVALWPETTAVDVAAIDAGPLQVTVDEDGETRVRERFVISAPVAGRLQRIEHEPGDTVVRGQTVLARLTPVDAPLIDPRARAELTAAAEAARAAVGGAQAERDRAAAALARARSVVRRQEDLDKAGLTTRDSVEAAQAAVRNNEEAVKAAEFAITRAQYDLQVAQTRLQAPSRGGPAVTIVAPISGTVLKRLRESESVVPLGEPLLEIGDPRGIEIVADLLSTDAVRIMPGADVIVEQWGGSDPIRGRVRRVEPSAFMKVSALGVEEQRVNVIVDFVDPDAAARVLGDNYRVGVRIVVYSRDETLRAPVGALFRRGEGWAAFVVDGGRVRLQPVTIGQRNDEFAEVTSGLTAGQTLVMHPPDTLADGMQVAVRSGD
jgi:HlyD family secretion protein